MKVNGRVEALPPAKPLAELAETKNQMTSANPIPALVAAAIVGTKPKTKERMKALKSVRYKLVTPKGAIWSNGIGVMFCDAASTSATVFDGRDNEVAKCAFFSALLKCDVIPQPISEGAK